MKASGIWYLPGQLSADDWGGAVMIPKRISGVRIRRSWVGRLVAVGALGCAMTVPVGSVRAYSAVLPLPSSTSTTPAIPTTPVSIPLSLQALEQKMGELKVTSLRFSEKTSVTVPHGEGKVLSLLKLLLGGG